VEDRVNFGRGREDEVVSDLSYAFCDAIWTILFLSEFMVRLGREGQLTVGISLE